jgi:hypothetical protein
MTKQFSLIMGFYKYLKINVYIFKIERNFQRRKIIKILLKHFKTDSNVMRRLQANHCTKASNPVKCLNF